jgi:Ca2+-binding RTX toxin-like protein
MYSRPLRLRRAGVLAGSALAVSLLSFTVDQAAQAEPSQCNGLPVTDQVPANGLFIGTGAAEVISGTFGADTIIGGGGNDTICGWSGNDEIDGGEQVDWISGGEDNDTIDGWGSGDVLYGNEGDDTIQGGDGNDIVRGGDDTDTLYGGDENDVLHCGQGPNDWADGGSQTMNGQDILMSVFNHGCETAVGVNP